MKLLVVIPAKDESSTIRDVIAQLKSCARFSDVLVVDDCSQDSTASVAQEAGAFVVTHIENKGAWLAMQTGLRFAVRNNYDAVMTMDADGQHLVEEAEKLWSGFSCENEVVIGRCTERGSLSRQLSWKLFRLLTGLSIQDITSGFRVYGNNAVRLLTSREASLLNYQDVGVLLMLRTAGIEVKEVDVKMSQRTNGISRIFSSWGKVAYYMFTTVFLCLTKAFPEKRDSFRNRISITD